MHKKHAKYRKTLRGRIRASLFLPENSDARGVSKLNSTLCIFSSRLSFLSEIDEAERMMEGFVL